MLHHPIFLVTVLVIFFVLVVLGVVVFMRAMAQIHDAEYHKNLLEESRFNATHPAVKAQHK